jgi:pilus assembly protein CpaB
MARSVSKMSKGSGRGLLLLALLFAAIAAVLAVAALSRSGGNDNEVSAADAKTVVVANQDIAARTELKSDMLKTIVVPADSALRGGYSDTETIVGQTTRYPLVENEQVTSLKIGISSDIKDQGLSFVVPAGMRAFSVKVTEETSVGGLVLPGDLVDVIGILDRDLVGADKAVTLIQSVEVLAVAQEAQEPIPPVAAETATAVPSGTSGERPEDLKPNPGARTVTLAVTPEQAQLLALVQTQGELALSLRSYGDTESAEPAESNLIPYGGVVESLP